MTLVSALALGIMGASADELIILHTNDTHSQIDPNEKDLGGILRRKALIDSVRAADPNVLLIDAGDIVQGTLFFNLYKGEIENRLMNDLGYDIRILGNHEFDNGIESMADMLSGSKSEMLSSNYRFENKTLSDLFKPYTIKEFGDKRVGIIAINLDPKGMIADDNAVGVTYLDPYDAANSLAWYLKHVDGVDYVIAVTHVGYAPENTTVSDIKLAERSRDIDVILGGHSHTVINPADSAAPEWKVVNAAGDTVVITQTGKSGQQVSRVALDLDNGKVSYRLMPVDKRYDDRLDASIAAEIEPYRHGVDSLMNLKLASTATALPADGPAMLNFVADFIRDNGNALLKAAGVTDKNVDLAIINKGGIRRSWPKGNISDGLVMTTLPFNNRTRVVDISGRDLLVLLDTMASRGGDGISSEMLVTFDPKANSIVSATIKGKDLNPAATYRVATIDYLANGGDYMTGFLGAKTVAESQAVLYDDLIAYMRINYKKKKINPDTTVRMSPVGR